MCITKYLKLFLDIYCAFKVGFNKFTLNNLSNSKSKSKSEIESKSDFNFLVMSRKSLYEKKNILYLSCVLIKLLSYLYAVGKSTFTIA